MFKIWANSADPNVDKSTSNSSVAKQHSLFEEDETTSQNSNFNPYIQMKNTYNSQSASTQFGSICVGARVTVEGGKNGTVRFLGPVHFKEGIWCGIELDLPIGKNNGTVYGVSYFVCQPNHGLFVSPTKVSLLSSSAAERSKITNQGSSKPSPNVYSRKNSYSTSKVACHSATNCQSSNLLKTPAEIGKMSPLVDFSPMDVEYRKKAPLSALQSSAPTGLAKVFGNNNTLYRNQLPSPLMISSTTASPSAATNSSIVNSSKYQNYPYSHSPSTPKNVQLIQENVRKQEEIDFLKTQISSYLVQLNEQKLAFNDLQREKEIEIENLIVRITSMISQHELAIHQCQQSYIPILEAQENYKEKIVQLENEIVRKDEEIAKFNERMLEMELVQEKLQVKDEEIHNLESNLNETKKRLQRIQEDSLFSDSQRKENETLQKQLADIRATNAKALSELSNCKENLIAKNSSLEFVSMELKRKDEKLQILEENIKKLMQNTDSNVEHQKAMLLLNEKIRTLEGENKQFQQKIANLTTELNGMKESAELKMEENSLLRKQIDSVSSEYSHDKSRIAEYKQNVIELEDKLKILESTVQQLSIEIKSSKELIEEYSSRNCSLTLQNDELNVYSASLEKRNSELNSEINELNDLNNTLDSARRESAEKISCLEQTSQMLNKSVEQLEKEKESLFSELNSLKQLNSSSNTLPTPWHNPRMHLTNQPSVASNSSIPVEMAIAQITEEFESNISLIQNVIELSDGSQNDLKRISEIIQLIQQEKDGLLEEVGRLLCNTHNLPNIEQKENYTNAIANPLEPNSTFPSTTTAIPKHLATESFQKIQTILGNIEKNNKCDEVLLQKIYSSLKKDYCQRCQLPGHLTENCIASIDSAFYK